MKPSRCDRCGKRAPLPVRATIATTRRVEWLCEECALRLESEMVHLECLNCGRSRPHFHICPDCDCCLDSCCECY